MNKNQRRFLAPLASLGLAVGLVGCFGDDEIIPPTLTIITPDTYVLTSTNKLIGFAAADPSKVLPVTLPVPASETLLGGDIRPADSTLYIVTRVTADNSLKVYTVNQVSGALGAAIPLLNNGSGAGGGTAGAAVLLTGSKVGVDFNPVANALRIIDSNGVNLRTTLAAGNNTFVDAPISTGLADAGYNNSFATTCQTDLYYINGSQFFITPAPNGLLSNAATPRLVGSLGVTADLNSGLDVRASATGNVFTAALRVGGAYGLYEVSVSTGAATLKAPIAGLGTDNVLSLVTTLPATAPTVNSGNMLAITGGAAPSLVTFNRPPQGAPNKLCSTAAITGLGAGETIVGADTRPKDGKLYALSQNGTAGKLYTIAATGVATAGSAVSVALSGTSFGLDFNPVPDRLRIVSDTGQNLRVDVDTGTATADTTLSNTQGGAARTGISAAAYTNSVFGGGGSSLFTSLFALDSSTNALVRIGSDPANGTAGDPGNPNSGVVNAIAPLMTANPDGTPSATALDIGDLNSFDIIGNNGSALVAAAAGSNAFATLYTVNLGTGAASRVQDFATPIVAMGPSTALTATVFGVTTTGNKLVSFAPATPGTVTAIGPVGVPAGETVLGLDFRPSSGARNGQLVALTSAGKLYAVDPATGAATALSTLTGTGVVVAATDEHGVDFNPLPDRLRTISVNGNNLRTAVETGATNNDTTTSQTGIFGAAYSNNITTAANTTLFVLRSNGATDELARVGASPANGTAGDPGNPNSGVVTSIGALGVDTSNLGDLDISGGQNGFVLAALQPAAGGVSGLYRVVLATGVATKIADINTVGSEPLRAMAIQVR